jgi:catechol 2,3-dioxygenase-like lactoylglutathione lyase family enzyme
LSVANLQASLVFWRSLLGFKVTCESGETGSACLERPDGAQIVLREHDGALEVAAFEYPLGRGVRLRIEVAALPPLATMLSRRAWPLAQPLAETWRVRGEHEVGEASLMVQDPDGYLILLVERLGERSRLEQKS